jgi:glycosyltransferase involved in cell wall biosynthesis
MNDFGRQNVELSDYSLSLVIPLHNEAQGIKETLRALQALLKELCENYEIIVVDDGSTDNTWEVCESMAESDLRIKLIRFTRNFGKEAAILAGLKQSKGDGVVVMDGDLQHPPELIKEMARLWREDGYEVVHGVKAVRQKESFFHAISSRWFYGVMSVLSGYDLRGATDYKLLDRSVVSRYVRLPEKERFFRGLIPWLGCKSTSVLFAPLDRKKGRSHWSPFGLVRLGVRAICSFSSLPMQAVSILGGLMFTSSLLLGLQTIYMKLTGQAVAGFATVIILLLFIGSILMVSLGLIGQYLAMIYEEIKGRPTFVIDRTRNI